jgi:hypothetical protein
LRFGRDTERVRSLTASISEALPLFERKLFGASIAALQLPTPPKFADQLAHFFDLLVLLIDDA